MICNRERLNVEFRFFLKIILSAFVIFAVFQKTDLLIDFAMLANNVHIKKNQF